MLTHSYSYEAALADAVKVGWQVDDLIGGDKRLDFTKPFMPESLAGVRGISCLNDREKLLLNQIRGWTYLYIFGFVEEYILPFVLDEARAATLGGGSAAEMRALATFAEEEAKHIHLFRRFAEEFAKGFGTQCDVIGPATEVAKVVLSHSKLGIGLLTLHIEWMTQAHYIDSVKDSQDLDPQFKSLLRHHWMEESQHAKLDTLLVDKHARAGGPEAVKQGFKDFETLGGAIDGLLAQQVQFDIVSLEKAAGRKFTDAEKQEIVAAQQKAYRYTFLVSGLVHRNFLTTVDQLSPGAADAMQAMARQLSA
jgi:hypothetical protein